MHLMLGELLRRKCVSAQIVAVITPQDVNGSSNSSTAQPDLALIGIPVASPYPMPPPAPAPAGAALPAGVANSLLGGNSRTAPAPAPAASAVNASAVPVSGTAATVAGRMPPAVTPAPSAVNAPVSTSLVSMHAYIVRCDG